MRALLAVLVVASALTAGCFGEGEGLVDEEAMSPIWEGYALIDQVPHDDARTFATIDLALNQSGETTWAVFNRDYGGNCCEHYLATTTAGAILNIGGEYPVYSVDRGHDWDTWILWRAARRAVPHLCADQPRNGRAG